MSLEFISLLSSDKLKLPGLLYQPEKPTTKAAVWLHGMGDNGVFYNPERLNALSAALNEAGIALLAFNNRGAHNRKGIHIADETLPEEDRRFLGGTHYELIADCVKDIDGAAAFLRQQSFDELYLLGHSTGANKICAYHVRAKQNPFSKYVLAGPGDDVGLFFRALGQKKFWAALKYAAKYAEDDPYKTMPQYTGMHPFSAQSAWDILNPDGDYNVFPFYEAAHERLGQKPLFKEYRQLDKPTLVIAGEHDDASALDGGTTQAFDILLQQTSNAMIKQTDYQIVPSTDHGFHDAETVFAKQVTEWLASS